MKKIFLAAVSVSMVLFFSTSGLADEEELECCCEMTCNYVRALGGSPTTIEVDQCWDTLQMVSSCDEDTACLKAKGANVFITYTNEWSGEGCKLQEPCPFSLMYGRYDPKLDTLRTFRDATLAKSALGRKVLEIYNDNTDTIRDALESSPKLRAVVKWTIDMIEPMLR